MFKVLGNANVAYVDDFLATIGNFDRTPYGELGYTIFIDEGAHNQVYLTFNWSSLSEAKSFWTSDIATSHVASWKSMSKPQFVYLKTRSV